MDDMNGTYEKGMKRFADVYVDRYGTVLLSELSEPDKNKSSLFMPRADKRIRALIKAKGKGGRRAIIASISAVAACITLVVLLQNIPGGSGSKSVADSASGAVDSAQAYTLPELSGAEIQNVSFEFPADYRVANAMLDDGMNVYNFESEEHGDVVLTIQKNARLPEYTAQNGMDEVLIDGVPVRAKVDDAYALLLFETEGLRYTLSSNDDLGALAAFYRKIVGNGDAMGGIGMNDGFSGSDSDIYETTPLPREDALDVNPENAPAYETPPGTSPTEAGIPIPNGELPASNLVFLIDISASMDSYDKLPLLKDAYSTLINTLGAKDRVSIVTYAGDSAVLLRGASGKDKNKLNDAVYSLRAGGATTEGKGIQTAYELAERYFIKGGNNRVILATDGDFNLGIFDISELSSFIVNKRETGVYLSVLGFGAGNIRNDIMETLAKDGGGNYSHIDNRRTAQNVLVNELGATG